jgi:sirohydrochlorin ferrochelatase
MEPLPGHIGLILVDHGSRRAEANRMLEEVVELFRTLSSTRVVEPAHMELAEPTLEQAFAKCIEQGATEIVVHPYFLSPGRHSRRDIPRMVAEAADKFPEVSYRVTEHLGVDAKLCEVVMRRVRECLAARAGE